MSGDPFDHPELLALTRRPDPCAGAEAELLALTGQRDRLRAALDSEIDHLWAMSRKYGYVGDGSIGMLVDMTNVAGSFDTLRRILSPDDYLTDTGAALTDDPEPAS